MQFVSDGITADILVVDDTLADRRFLANVLGAQGYRVRTAAGGVPALTEVRETRPDLILLDINMPEMNGFELCSMLKKDMQLAAIPIIFISGFDDTHSKVSGFDYGGVDYVTKPFKVAELKARIRAHLQMKRSLDRLGFQAVHDPLTGLPNRNLLFDRLHQAISYAERYQSQVAVAYIDLDGFKDVNDTFGHEAGDELLTEVARRLQACVRESDTVARMGGDEFVIVFYEQANEDVTLQATQRILNRLAEPYMWHGRAIGISCSIGFAFFPQDGKDAGRLIKNADTAMYRAKQLGRNNVQFYTAGDFCKRSDQRSALQQDIRSALEREEFTLHYQPRADLGTGKITGLEALIRWHHPQLGIVQPPHFLPLAEEAGLMHPIGEWVLRAACRQYRAWQRNDGSELPILLNVSAAQFLQNGFTRTIDAALRDAGMPARHLEIEITESLSIQDPAKTLRILRELKELGVGLSIDDFGTGCSNLVYLKQFPLDTIKLAPAFIRSMAPHRKDLAFFEAIISLAHSLHFRVVAEGVESENQMTLLADLGCDEIQGDFVGPAVPADVCASRLRENRALRIKSPF